MANLRTTIVALPMPISLSFGTLAGEPASGCFIEHNFFYPKDGMNESSRGVSITSAEKIRQRTGLHAGRMLIAVSAISGRRSMDGPNPPAIADIASLTEYANEAEAQAATEQLVQSKEYRAVLAEMGSKLRHFDAVKGHQARSDCVGDVK